MAWYWYVLFYVVYVLLFSFIYLRKKAGSEVVGADYLKLLVVTVLLIGVMPFMWIYWFFELLDRGQYETFTIHNLTKENKVALRQLGFREGTFISSTNFKYTGFRKRVGFTTISVCNDGKISVYGNFTSEVKFYIAILLLLPRPEPKELEIKEPLKEEA